LACSASRATLLFAASASSGASVVEMMIVFGEYPKRRRTCGLAEFAEGPDEVIFVADVVRRI
jgi:hypothetical protein